MKNVQKSKFEKDQYLDEILNELKLTELYANILPSSSAFNSFDKIENKFDENTQNKLKEYVGNNGLRHIAICEVASFLKTKFKYEQSEPKRTLEEVLTEAEIKKIANEILYKVKRLPIKYGFVFELPHAIFNSRVDDTTECVISQNIKIIYNPSECFGRFDYKSYFSFSGNTALQALTRARTSWNDNAAYMIISLEGYCGEYGGDAIVDNFTTITKEFLGLFYAKNSITRSYGTIKSHNKMMVACFELGKRNTQIYDFEIHSDLFRSFQSVIWEIWDDINKKKLNIGMTHFQKNLSQISNVATSQTVHPNLKTAAQWFFDSIMSSNSMISFIQATTAIEVMFGDKDETEKVGLTNLLANRYAFSVGTSHKDRINKLKEFKRIYGIRCSIVHNGKNKLSTKEMSDYEKLKTICALILSKEISNAHLGIYGN